MRIDDPNAFSLKKIEGKHEQGIPKKDRRRIDGADRYAKDFFSKSQRAYFAKNHPSVEQLIKGLEQGDGSDKAQLADEADELKKLMSLSSLGLSATASSSSTADKTEPKTSTPNPQPKINHIPNQTNQS